MERPALQKLLADIQERRIDIVVVYKVDRLTRSLTDFAKLVELFDGHSVSFVSVTSPSIRPAAWEIDLNVLLSFAQFERGSPGERIRDRSPPPRRRDMGRRGGSAGLSAQDRKLLVDEEEAKIVRLVFERYLALGSLPALATGAARARHRHPQAPAFLRRHPRRRSPDQRTAGPSLTQSDVSRELNHRDKSYPGEHQPSSNRTFSTKFRLDSARIARKSVAPPAIRRASSRQAVRRSRNKMTPSYAIKGGVRYRYYVSSVLAQGRKEETGIVSRIGSDAIESIVLDAWRPLLPSEDTQRQHGQRSQTAIEEPPRPRWTPAGLA